MNFKIGDNWPIGRIFTWIVRHIAHFKSLKSWRSQVFLMCIEIYIHVFAIIKQPT